VLDGQRVAPELETAVYRIAQEALTNVAKHAHAQHVALELRREPEGLRLTVEDDGVGFDPGGPLGGFGLVGMRERLELAGGTLEVRPREPGGTRVEAWFPLARAEAAALDD
jgi:signal transduction histidine kinase